MFFKWDFKKESKICLLIDVIHKYALPTKYSVDVISPDPTSRFALKALMYTGPPTWVSSYSIPIFSHLEVSDLGGKTIYLAQRSRPCYLAAAACLYYGQEMKKYQISIFLEADH